VKESNLSGILAPIHNEIGNADASDTQNAFAQISLKSTATPRRRPLHSWRLTPKRAISLQTELRGRLIDEPIHVSPRLVAGADIAYSKKSNRLFAAVILFRLPEMEVIETTTEVRDATFPYVPGLLSFREAPALIAAFRKLRRKPDAAIFDGQGRAHPRGLGLAAHVGLWLRIPTIGCAKSRLCGEAAEPGPEPRDAAPLLLNGEVIGHVLRTRRSVKPLFVSAGHLCTLRDAVRLVLDCSRGYRLPEPTRQAHILVTRLRANA
jgi:deoxyribonuclease V